MRIISFKDSIKITDFKKGDIIGIKKMESGYQLMFECKFIEIDKRGKIVAKILDGRPSWALRHREFNKGMIIKTIAKNIWLWGKGTNDKWERCHWYNKETKSFD